MDWSKIKTILIIALLLANLVLGYEVYKQKAAIKDNSYSENFQRTTLNLLEKEGIELDPKVELKKESLNSLRVQYENLKEEEINQRFFENEALLQQKTLSLLRLVYDEENLSVYDGRRLSYENKIPVGEEKITEEEAEEIALNFLKKRSFSTKDLKLINSKTWNKGYELTYKEVYAGTLVETTYSKFKVDKTGVHNFDRLWLEVVEPSERQITMISPEKALLNLLDKKEAQGKKVISLEPCYYFNPSQQGYIEDISRAQQGRAIPAWRIQLDGGEEIIVDTLS